MRGGLNRAVTCLRMRSKEAPHISESLGGGNALQICGASDVGDEENRPIRDGEEALKWRK